MAGGPAGENQARWGRDPVTAAELVLLAAPMSSSDAVTRGVRIHVECRYSPERSEPARREWFFLYTVRITNEGAETVELKNRHWIITNAHGTVQEVRGPG